jgi:hypothetical protein
MWYCHVVCTLTHVPPRILFFKADESHVTLRIDGKKVVRTYYATKEADFKRRCSWKVEGSQDVVLVHYFTDKQSNVARKSKAASKESSDNSRGIKRHKHGKDAATHGSQQQAAPAMNHLGAGPSAPGPSGAPSTLLQHGFHAVGMAPSYGHSTTLPAHPHMQTSHPPNAACPQMLGEIGSLMVDDDDDFRILPELDELLNDPNIDAMDAQHLAGQEGNDGDPLHINDLADLLNDPNIDAMNAQRLAGQEGIDGDPLHINDLADLLNDPILDAMNAQRLAGQEGIDGDPLHINDFLMDSPWPQQQEEEHEE